MDNGADDGVVDEETVKNAAIVARAFLDGFLAQGFTREEAFTLTVIATKAGFDQQTDKHPEKGAK